MIRLLHRWPGLILVALLVVTALSGAALSVFPALETARSPQAEAELSVAELAARVQAVYPGVEQIRRAPSGRITAWWFADGRPGSAVIDPLTGQAVASADPDPLQRWLTNLHRSLFLGDGGRLIVAAGALAMLILAVSGALLVARRTGGWRRWFIRLRGPLAGRLHTDIARFVVLGLAWSSVTALWLSAQTFEIVTIEPARLALTNQTSGRMGLSPRKIPILADTPVAALRDLRFPATGDANDAFMLKADLGIARIDQGSGAVLGWAPRSGWERVSDVIAMLHTGKGAAWLGLVLGLMALGVPVLGVTGGLVWFAGRQARPKFPGNSLATKADTVVLVGSEGGSTWGFAATLLRALRGAGKSVHVGPMTGFDPARYPGAQRFIVLTATYGDGDAPASARGFLEHLVSLRVVPSAPIAVLGFGDRSFAAYCAFARAVDLTARTRGWATLLPYDTIDRQSSQAFAVWGRSLGRALGIELTLVHQPRPPSTERLTLLARRDYDQDTDAPASILRFTLPRVSFWQGLSRQGFARFEAGDLLGIMPDGSTVPRLYSLSSGVHDGFIEIVVRKHPGGLCSGQLTTLEPGRSVRAFLRRNPGFHAGRGRSPLILIGAGTGIGPLAGFIRANERRRPMQLYFGMRRADTDFLFDDDLRAWQAGGQLARLVTALSRGARPQHVQDALRAEAGEVAQAVASGGQIMVCGGRDMARGVRAALADILRPIGLTPDRLIEQGRYREDVY